jgi:dTDP-4-amino-4,6-dideoxygalactose transaminase
MESLKLVRTIRLSKSCLSDAEKQAVLGVLDREFLGMGTEVGQFEEALTEFFGRSTVCVANGTAALQLALQACGIGAGDEVLVQSLTYVASFQAISATGAMPVACDINSKTLTLDWHDAEKRLTPKTKALMPVHYSGGVGALDEIYAFAHKHSLRVIEDAAHAFGTTYQGKRIGGFGDIVCFSFDGIKNITSGEGGCIVTGDLNVLCKVQNARLLGVDKDTEKRYTDQRSWEFDVTSQGWRYHMSNIMAAIGFEQLDNFPLRAEKRQRLARRYDALLCEHQRIQILPKDYVDVVPHIYVVRILGMQNRTLLQKQLLVLGIQTGIHYQPNHMLSFYKEQTRLPLPITDYVFPELLSLPLHPDLNEEDVDFVCETLMELIL